MTINYKPLDYVSACEDIIVTAIDAHWSLDPNYKYVAALFYDTGGSTWVQITSQQVRPHPVSGYGIFTFTKECQNVFSPALKINNTATTLFDFFINEIYAYFKVELREEYVGSISAVLATGYFNLANSYNKDYNSLTYDVFFNLVNSPGYKYASNRSGVDFQISKRSQYFVLPILNFTGNDPKNFDITYNGFTYNVDVADLSARHFNISVQALLNEGCTIDYNVPKDLVIQEGGGGATLAVLKYNVVCDNQADHYCLHFLNQYGCFEPVLFSKPAIKTIKREASYYERLRYDIDSSGQYVRYEPSSVMTMIATKKAYNTKYKETIKLKSDFVSDADYIWLKELIMSPMVYCSINDSDAIIPITITDNNYNENRYVTNKLSQLSIEIELHNDFKTQVQ